MAYYQAVQKVLGGAAATSTFARLFLLPDVAHCGGGQGPDKLDALTAIVDWVTKGQGPDSLLTKAVDSSGKTTSSRPTYPIPYVARTPPAVRPTPLELHPGQVRGRGRPDAEPARLLPLRLRRGRQLSPRQVGRHPRQGMI